MRFLYVSRNLNRSGYWILRHLLEKTSFRPCVVLLPESPHTSSLDKHSSAPSEVQHYQEEIRRSGAPPLKFLNSIQLLAEDAGLPVCRRRTLKSDESLSWIRSLDPDLITLGGGWPELLPEGLISLPTLGVINTHPSLLPEFRGTDVHRWQIAHGVTRSGATIHYVDARFDQGEILGQASVEIGMEDTPQDLADKSARVAGPLMEEVLSRIRAAAPRRIRGMPQLHRGDITRYFSRWKWESEDFLRVNWNQTAVEIACFVRACTQESYQYNGPFFDLAGHRVIIREAVPSSSNSQGMPGEVLEASSDGLLVACGTLGSVLLIRKIQITRPEDWPKGPHLEPSAHPLDMAPRLLLQGRRRFTS